MKSAIALFLPLVLLLAACAGVDTHRAAIESLSSEWDEATNAVMELSGTVQQEQATFQEDLTNLAPNEEAVNAVKEDQQAILMDAYHSLQTSGNAYSDLSNEVNAFMAEWTEKSNEVAALKEGLNEGQLSKDVNNQITSLNAFVAEVPSKIDMWNQQLADARLAVTDRMNSYETVVAEVLPNQ